MDHGGLMASVVLDEPSLELSPVLLTEIFRRREADQWGRPRDAG